MRSDERMDELMDAALRSYAEPGEIPAARVVAARVMEWARSLEGRRRFWRWALMVPATGCLLIALTGAIWTMWEARVPEIAWVPKAPGVMGSINDVRKGAKAQSSSSTFSAQLRSCPDTKSCKAESPSSRADDTSAMDEVPGMQLPKMEVFPTPRPLTAEEQTLMAFTEQATPTVKKQFVEGEKHLGDPIAIAELKIRPLDEKDRE
jgi:hypothetical protein